jgi:hypothetical protein
MTHTRCSRPDGARITGHANIIITRDDDNVGLGSTGDLNAQIGGTANMVRSSWA